MKPKKAWPYVGNIHGKQFAELLKEYVSEFSSSGGVLNIRSIGSRVVETLLNDVHEKAFDKYTSKMDGFLKSVLPCPNHEVVYKHKTCLDRAMQYFNVKSKYIKDSDSLSIYRKKLLERIAVYSDNGLTCVGGHLKTSLASNVKQSDAFCKKIVDDLFKEKLKPLMDSCEEDDTGKSIDVESAINDVETEYKKRARGPQIWHVYKTELAEKITIFTDALLKSDTTEASAKSNISQREVANSKEEVKDQENVEELMRSLKIEKEKIMHLSWKDDIVEQKKGIANDREEGIAAILSQVNQLLKSHPGLANELQILIAQLKEESKTKEKELMKKHECTD
ncbi:uncharacterized protein PF3D7_1120000-like [Ptychodera flava]|uniref:uncharacterized protein PF3D7_1120000-like n=1 Tax=Ptychodera flava TaxID=63121 RepID=UPI00396A0F5E